jgi:ubiquinone/menaquinone biosynthesis C-methylase UbiE
MTILFLFFVLVLALMWVIVPAVYGLPSVPAGRERIRRALRLADLRAGEVLYDLGAGDGRVLVIAAKEFGARATGIEIGPVQCLVCWGNALVNGVRQNVRVVQGNFLRADLSEADVVFVYATSKELARLQSRLESQLREGARVVTVGSDFPDWKAVRFHREELIFVYVMPPQYGRTIQHINGLS